MTIKRLEPEIAASLLHGLKHSMSLHPTHLKAACVIPVHANIRMTKKIGQESWM